MPADTNSNREAKKLRDDHTVFGPDNEPPLEQLYEEESGLLLTRGHRHLLCSPSNCGSFKLLDRLELLQAPRKAASPPLPNTTRSSDAGPPPAKRSMRTFPSSSSSALTSTASTITSTIQSLTQISSENLTLKKDLADSHVKIRHLERELETKSAAVSKLTEEKRDLLVMKEKHLRKLEEWKDWSRHVQEERAIAKEELESALSNQPKQSKETASEELPSAQLSRSLSATLAARTRTEKRTRVSPPTLHCTFCLEDVDLNSGVGKVEAVMRHVHATSSPYFAAARISANIGLHFGENRWFCGRCLGPCTGCRVGDSVDCVKCFKSFDRVAGQERALFCNPCADPAEPVDAEPAGPADGEPADDGAADPATAEDAESASEDEEGDGEPADDGAADPATAEDAESASEDEEGDGEPADDGAADPATAEDAESASEDEEGDGEPADDGAADPATAEDAESASEDEEGDGEPADDGAADPATAEDAESASEDEEGDGEPADDGAADPATAEDAESASEDEEGDGEPADDGAADPATAEDAESASEDEEGDGEPADDGAADPATAEDAESASEDEEGDGEPADDGAADPAAAENVGV